MSQFEGFGMRVVMSSEPAEAEKGTPATLEIASDDESLYDAIFELQIDSYDPSEPDQLEWRNTT